MGILLTKLWRLWSNDQQQKIIIIGLDNAGKTTLLYRLLLNQTVPTTPTIGSNVEEVTYKNIKFLMWDLGGQDSLRTSWSTYFVDAKAVVMVVDSTDKKRLHLVKEELQQLVQQDSVRDASMLVYANKQDLAGSLSATQISEALDLTSLKDHPWQIQACSAKKGEGIHEGLDWIVTQLISKST
ncbi:ARF-like protein [Thamnocephalis sphaerospora]|uniref:ARF-like protein n=1 Tax=Thamnocephalis sphaerospora TaxID=78915 RepID=A0A4P9XRQ9_9FUNG|nr:ARF-like protein [Thamnocephalis sphaerospora]|eukprot:RKP08784.1 ARF-like protein [Thamnocephalis sphaerospora]